MIPSVVGTQHGTPNAIVAYDNQGRLPVMDEADLLKNLNGLKMAADYIPTAGKEAVSVSFPNAGYLSIVDTVIQAGRVTVANGTSEEILLATAIPQAVEVPPLSGNFVYSMPVASVSLIGGLIASTWFNHFVEVVLDDGEYTKVRVTNLDTAPGFKTFNWSVMSFFIRGA